MIFVTSKIDILHNYIIYWRTFDILVIVCWDQGKHDRAVWFQLRLFLYDNIIFWYCKRFAFSPETHIEHFRVQRSIRNFKFQISSLLAWVLVSVDSVTHMADWTGESWLGISLYLISQPCWYKLGKDEYWLVLIDRLRWYLVSAIQPILTHLFFVSSPHSFQKPLNPIQLLPPPRPMQTEFLKLHRYGTSPRTRSLLPWRRLCSG